MEETPLSSLQLRYVQQQPVLVPRPGGARQKQQEKVFLRRLHLLVSLPQPGGKAAARGGPPRRRHQTLQVRPLPKDILHRQPPPRPQEALRQTAILPLPLLPVASLLPLSV